MKIALINYSGNVGKTTMARDVFKRRLPGYEIVSVESVNNDGQESVIIRGDDGENLHIEIIYNDGLILDVGSSNLEAFFRSSAKVGEILNKIDLFVLPVTPERKQQQDTIKTIKDLLEAKVAPSKIHVICNQIVVDPLNPVEEIFSVLKKATSQYKIGMDFRNVIEKHTLYSSGRNLSEMLSDEDFMAKMQEAKLAGNREEARKYAAKVARQSALRNLDKKYQEIFDRLMKRNNG